MHTQHHPKLQAGGFTLLELIGVMAVMAILAGALAPSVMRLIEEGFQGAEQQSMETLGVALGDYILATQSIPASGDWVDAVSSYAALAPDTVRLNQKKRTRRIYYDPHFFTGSDTAFSGYTQTQGLATRPVSPRIMIVSDLNGEISANLNTAALFNAVWDQSATSTITESKSLIITRLNLNNRFKRALLSNAASVQASFQLEGNAAGAIGAAVAGIDGTREVFVIHGTRLRLNATPYPSGATLRQLIVNQDVSLRYSFDGSTWSWI